MKKICKKIIVTLLIAGMVFTQPLTLLAADEPVVSDKMEFLADNEESLVTDAGETEADEADEIEENLTEAPGAEEIKAGEFLTEDPVEVDTDSEKNGVPVYKTVTDSFGNQYEYNISTWYKDYRSEDRKGYTWELDKTNKKLILRGYNTQNPIVKSLYIPATTVIDGETYTTQIPLYGTGIYGSPFEQLPGDRLEHVYIAAGVEIVDGDNRAFGTFESCENLKSVDMKNVDFSKVHSLDRFFRGCTSLQEIAFGTHYENVVDMSDMFRGCTSLKEINLSTLDLAGTKNAESAFFGCSALENASLSGLDLSAVTSLKYMFSGCSSLKSINLSGLKLSAVTDMSYMFQNCSSLDCFEFPDTDTSGCTSIEDMFYGCNKLKVLDLSRLKTNSLTDMSGLCDAPVGNELLLEKLCLPYGLESFPVDVQPGTHNYYYVLPKKMYHSGNEVNSQTRIHSGMSGWILTADNTPLVNGPETQKDENGKIVRSTWDCIWFGHYFQDQDEFYMDKDPIKWRILSIDDNGEALLLADQNLATWQYNGSETAVSWENSEIRKWLNSDNNCSFSDFNYLDNLGFTRNAFSFAEWAAIIESDIDGGKDKVFLLSYDDVNNTAYGFNNTPAEADVTKTAMNSTYCENGYKGWFLRERSYTVNSDGSIYGNDARNYLDRYKVRPAIRLNLYDHADLWADAGTVTIDQEGSINSDEPQNKPASITYEDYRWKFNNNRLEYEKAYGGFTNRNRHRITQSDYEYFLSNLSPTEQDRFRNYIVDNGKLPDRSDNIDLEDYDQVIKYFKDWFGSCYGMSLTEGLYLDGKYTPPGGYDTLGAVGSIAHDHLNVESSINTFHFMENTDSGMLHQGAKPSEIKNKAKAVKNSSDYFLISITVPSWKGSRHAILCQGGEECNISYADETYTYRLKIYDPNSSVYRDDFHDMYISSDEKTAIIPYYGFRCKEDIITWNMDMYYWKKSPAELAEFPKVIRKQNLVRSGMKYVEIYAVTSGLECVFILAMSHPELVLGGLLYANYVGRNGYVEGSEPEFAGGYYELGDIDPTERYRIKGGDDDNLDAAFEYGDHTVGVYADTKGVSAEFSNNGDVKLQGMDHAGTGFNINNVYNEEYSEKPCNATEVSIWGKTSSDVEFKQSKEGGYELTTSDGETISDVSMNIGSPLYHDKHELEDAAGKITVNFTEGLVIVREDTDGDGTLDHEERFLDHAQKSDDDIPDDAPNGIWIRGLEKEYTYTGSPIKPSFKVYRGKTRLYEKTDYTLKFTNNTKPGNAKVTVTMKGNHSGSKDLYFQIVPADLTKDITADTVYLAYKKNKEQKPKPVLYVDGTKLKFGANDLTFTYPSEDKDGKRAYVDEGTYRIHIEPKNNTLFTGSADVDLVIAQKTLMSAVSVRADKNSLAYDDGKEISPVFTLTYKNQPLIKDQDYTVSYADDPNTVGKHTVIFTGNNTDYFGSKVYTFTVTGKYDLASARAEVSLDPEDLDEDGKALFTYGGAMPGAIVKYNGVKLTAGKDYTVSYKNHKALGTATATVKGKGSYKGSVPIDFTVKQRDINTLSLNLGDVLYTVKKDGYKKVPVSFVDQNYKDQKLKANTDYSLTFIGTYGDAPAAGTEIHVRVKGKGNYTGTIEASYRIKDKALDFSKAKVSVNGGKAYDYTGSRIEPAKTDLVVTLANKPLGNDDYEILGCYNNIRKGNSAYIRLRGKGSYAGDKVVKFKIGAAPLKRIWSDVIIRLKGIFNP